MGRRLRCGTREAARRLVDLAANFFRGHEQLATELTDTSANSRIDAKKQQKVTTSMATSTHEPTATETSALELSYKAALDARRPVLRAIAEDQILRDLRLDATHAAAVAEGTAKKLLPYRDAIAARFGEDAAVLVDELLTTARATKQADIELTLAEPSADMSELAKDVSHVYSMLMADATSLSKRRLLDGTRLEKARSIKGYRALLTSTLLLIALLREEWPKIEGRAILSLEELDYAEAVALRLSTALTDRDQNVDGVPARELRARALSKLVRDYRQLHRMMQYLRYDHGDVDEIIPSFWATRGRTRRTEQEEPIGEPNAEQPSNGQPTNEEPDPPVPPTPGDDDSPFTP